jgi:predicted ATPase
MAKLKSGTRIYGTATIDTSVVVGSGVTITTNGINVVGVVTATDFNSASDLSLKTNIQSISNPIDKILQINGVTFNWRESNKPSVGIIAQEIEKVFPELVNGENPKTVNYNGLIGLLIEAIKEQQTEINNLKDKLK